MTDRTEFELDMIAKKNLGIPFTREDRVRLHGDCTPGITGGELAEVEYNKMLVERYQAGLWLSVSAKKEARRLIRVLK